ncbi:MAG: dipeptide epimerase [Proteobacteria bacterium]|nr:dipeptide epimerase [Pseudomonadota bacterium]
MPYEIRVEPKTWLLRKPFRISRDEATHAETLLCHISDGTHTGSGEAAGVTYKGETIDSIKEQIEAVMPQIAGGISRDELQQIMPPGGARNAVDCALWDLEAKQSGRTVWQMLDWQPHAVTTVYTVGIDTAENMQKDAAAHADFPILKVKVGIGDPLEQLAAIRKGSPDAAIVIDANQAWTIDDLDQYAAGLKALHVEMVEQPLAIADDEALRDFESPIPLCADESCDSRADLDRLAGLYEIINIKLDKTGGLTEALALALQAESMGFDLMVGNMLGSSLAMAPAFVIAQRCRYVDIDGPLLQAQDCAHPLIYKSGQVEPFSPELWA